MKLISIVTILILTTSILGCSQKNQESNSTVNTNIDEQQFEENQAKSIELNEELQQQSKEELVNEIVERNDKIIKQLKFLSPAHPDLSNFSGEISEQQCNTDLIAIDKQIKLKYEEYKPRLGKMYQ